MSKKIVRFLLIISLYILSTSYTFATSDVFDLTQLEDGVITLNYNVRSTVKTKLMIQFEDSKYYYDLLDINQTFPLQLGNGDYSVVIFEQQDSGKYSAKAKTSFTLELKNINAAYLSSNEIISWNKQSKTTILAQSLTQDLSSDYDKVEAIHNYIVNNIKYDNTKYETLDSTYMPNPNQILYTKSGICYDYASLFAAMTRSLDIPTKLVKGYKNDISEYHAWNQVLINDEWLTVDTTYNTTLYSNNFDTSLIMSDYDYVIKKIY